MQAGVRMEEYKVQMFIKSFNEAAKEKVIQYDLKRKSTIYLREIGWTPREMLDYVCANLSVNTYSIGPTLHHNGSGHNVMVFGIFFEQQLLYVKLSYGENGSGACMSFHPNEKEMEFPYRKDGVK